MQRYTINRDFLETIRQAGGTGRYQEYADAALRGFGVKVTPQGGIAYYYRWIAPGGRHGRKVVGHYPATAPSAARELAKKIGATLDHRQDDDVTLIAKHAARENNAQRARVVPTVGEYLTQTYGPHFRSKSKNKSRADRTITDIRKDFAGFMDTPLNRLGMADLAQWRTDELFRVKKPATRGTPAQYVKPATMNRKMNAFRGLLAHAHACRIITANPAEGMAKEDEGSGVVRWLKPDEEHRLRAVLDDRETRNREHRERINGDPRRNDVFEPHHAFTDYVKPAVLFALNTGLRRNEQLTLRWDDIDLHARTATVRDENSKVNRTRVVPLCAEAFEVISAWRAQCFQGNVHPIHVFTNAAGELLREVTYWAGLLKAAQVRGFRWHDLRHSFATRAVEQGVPLDVVSRWMGHSRIEQTMRYAHRDNDFNARAIAALDRARMAAVQAMQQAA
ncbi:Tyrosine recombinase XerC [Paraburkholderia nemoris]|uniref:site-specific integrase n=1 Tax=Paraburkholderia nemoris TaxID=2793076 RepID=UPI00190ACB65|nr:MULTISPECIES: site-specific integrase [Paraburkholderia]MBK3786737.1 site-specific integrase [Paraburkholderia aspalathi]CAE6860729.1 Tyrosine recombinase XerC [Paraburkholderia nemoris]